VHGANRLASNRLLEALVVGRRLALHLLDELPPLGAPADDDALTGGSEPGQVVDPAGRGALTAKMSRYAGVLRDPVGLSDLAEHLVSVPVGGPHRFGAAAATRAAWEATNLHAIGSLLVAAARQRLESRGCHRRTDISTESSSWRRHIVAESVPMSSATAGVPDVVSLTS
jgi:aspartate oxidase